MAVPTTLRPLRVGEILDAGLKVVTQHWRPLMLCVVGLVLPVQIVYTLILAFLAPEQLGLDPEPIDRSNFDAGPVAGVLVGAVLILISFLIVFTACFKIVADVWLGAAPDVRRSLRFGVSRLGPVLALGLVWTVAIAFATLAFVVPGLWLAVAWCLSLPVALFERPGVVKSLGRSFALVKGRWWPTALSLLVGYVLVSLLGAIVQGLLLALSGVTTDDNVLANSIAQVVGGTVSSALTMPYLAAVLTILYFDQRVRKEGFDLERLAEGLGSERDRDAPAGPRSTPEQRAAAPYRPPPPGWSPPAVGPEPEDPWRSPAGWTGPSPTPFEPPAPREAPEDDPERADWQPPEAPRGPGGL